MNTPSIRSTRTRCRPASTQASCRHLRRRLARTPQTCCEMGQMSLDCQRGRHRTFYHDDGLRMSRRRQLGCGASTHAYHTFIGGKRRVARAHRPLSQQRQREHSGSTGVLSVAPSHPTSMLTLTATIRRCTTTQSPPAMQVMSINHAVVVTVCHSVTVP